jgi:hypothetical protein
MLAQLVGHFIDYKQKKDFKKVLKLLSIPKETQLNSLKLILKRSEGCEIKKKLGLDGVMNYEDFYKLCPTTDYNDYKALTASMYQSDNSKGKMSPLPCDYFVLTSGTTSEPKYIPLQNNYREEYMRVFLPWLGCIKTLRPETFSGKAIYLADVALLGDSPTGVPCGVMSGYNFRKIPSFIRKKLYCTHEDFYALGDPKKRDITLLAHSMASDVTLLGTIMPETIINFLNTFFTYSKEVIDYLKTGRPPFDYPSAFKKSLIMRPNPRAAQRAELLKIQGYMNNLHDFYPSLKTIICWKSASASFYLERIKNFIPHDVVVWDGVYSASEGWFNFPLNPQQTGGPIAITGHFLEFKEWSNPDSPFLGAWELEKGKDYELFITTSMGMFRYRMYDRITVTGYHSATPIIEFVEKTGEFLDHAMERITPQHVAKLMEQVIAENKLDRTKISYFTMSPCHKQGLLHYSLLVETDYGPENFKSIALDDALSQINPNYGRNRRGKLLGPLTLSLLKPGHIQEVLRKREQKGLSIAQFKYSMIEKDTNLTKEVCPCDH